MIKCLISLGLGFAIGFFALVIVIYVIGKREMKKLNKWE